VDYLAEHVRIRALRCGPAANPSARRTTPGGQSSYSELAIETGMMLRLAFHLALRQTEGLMVSIFGCWVCH
jgi:hypothetical protein